GGIPEHPFGVCGVDGERRDVVGEDQAEAAVGAGLLLVRVAAVHHHVDAVEAVLEEALVGLELELVRHDADRIRQHAVLGDDGEALDAPGADHDAACCGGPPSGAPRTASLRWRGSDSGCSRWRKSIIFSRTSQRRSKTSPAVRALTSTRTSM